MTTAIPETPDDSQLSSEGLAASGEGKILLLACGALAREIIDVKTRNGWDHMDLTCLPAILHNSPHKITNAVRAAVEKHKPNYDQIFVVYADCGTGGLLQAACVELGVEMVAGPHCYAFFDGLDAFEARDEVTSFYLTDFLVRQFDSFIWKPLGLAKHPSLLEMYFGNYETLVYLSQVDDPKLVEMAEEQANRMGLRFEHRRTGYGDLETTLSKWSHRDAR